eukprot:Lankesteria_metandrocarpae@DN1439_c0_g1_i1.p1
METDLDLWAWSSGQISSLLSITVENLDNAIIENILGYDCEGELIEFLSAFVADGHSYGEPSEAVVHFTKQLFNKRKLLSNSTPAPVPRTNADDSNNSSTFTAVRYSHDSYATEERSGFFTVPPLSAQTLRSPQLPVTGSRHSEESPNGRAPRDCYGSPPGLSVDDLPNDIYSKTYVSNRDVKDSVASPSARSVSHSTSTALVTNNTHQPVAAKSLQQSDGGRTLNQSSVRSGRAARQRRKRGDEEREVCRCLATDHPLIANCLKCGKIVCAEEGEGPCLFCGDYVTGKSDIISFAKANDNFLKAVQMKERLVQYDREVAKRTHVYDDSTDWYSEKDNYWLEDAQRHAASKFADTHTQLTADRSGRVELTVDIENLELREESAAKAALERMTRPQEYQDQHYDLPLMDSAYEDEREDLSRYPESIFTPKTHHRSNNTNSEMNSSLLVFRVEANDNFDTKQDDLLTYVTNNVLYGISRRDKLEYNTGSLTENKRKKVYEVEDCEAVVLAEADLDCDTNPRQGLAADAKDYVIPNKHSSPEFVMLDSSFVISPNSADLGMCLSMHQPWASLVVSGFKRIEGRSWKSSYVGRLWIHAAAQEPNPDAIASCHEQYTDLYGDKIKCLLPSCYPSSCLLGCVDMTHCLSELEALEMRKSDASLVDGYFWDEGNFSPFLFHFRQPRRLVVPIRMKGDHKMWKLPANDVKAYSSALRPVLWFADYALTKLTADRRLDPVAHTSGKVSSTAATMLSFDGFTVGFDIAPTTALPDSCVAEDAVLNSAFVSEMEALSAGNMLPRCVRSSPSVRENPSIDIVADDLIILRQLFNLTEQKSILSIVRSLGRTNFFVPNNEKANPFEPMRITHVRTMYLGRHYNETLRMYEMDERGDIDCGPVPTIPPVFETLYNFIVKSANAGLRSSGLESSICVAPPAGKEKIAVLRCFDEQGRLPLQQCNAETSESRSSGYPMVYMAFGSSCEFAFSNVALTASTDAMKLAESRISIKSGDAVLIGKRCRNWYFGAMKSVRGSMPFELEDFLKKESRVDISLRIH